MLFALLALHALLALAAPALGRRLGRHVFLVCGIAPLATIAWAATRADAILGGVPVTESVAWVPAMGVVADLRLDAFALVMTVLVSGIGTLIFAYAWAYFAKPKPGLGGFTAALTAFAGSMLGLVWADNLLLIFAFWEATSITSFLLIGFENRKESARHAAQQALLVTGMGGLALLGGLVILGEVAGDYSLSGLLAAPPSGGVVEVALVLVLIGAFTKSAQAPFHSWLPGAMAAPTPVSAYLHSATMVKAGVYLIARFAPAFADSSVWQPLAVTVGVVTMLIGAWRALRQRDLKLVLAYGTISQLGLMVVLFGTGMPKAVFAGVALLLAHGIFKAALFMIVGIVDHETGTRDLQRLQGLWRVMPVVFVAGLVTAASMAGLPPLLGFIAKEAAFEGLLGADLGTFGWVALAGVVGGSMLTFAYSARFVYGAFATKPDEYIDQLEGPAHGHRPPALFVAPAALLAAASVLFGIAPPLIDRIVNAGALALHPGWQPIHVALWHGLNLALGLSVLAVGVGFTLFALRARIEHIQSSLPALPGSQQAYDGSVRGLLAGAKRLTGVVQNGSLPVYLGVITLTLVAVPSVPLLPELRGLGAVPLSANPVQAGVAALIAVAAIGTLAARRRFSAVLMLGGAGFGVAILFAMQGAPDLALTQLLVETLAVVIFVLVLRHLPAKFTRTEVPAYKFLRAGAATLVGVFIFAFTLVAAGSRTADPVSGELLARSLPEAHGRNVVNVILVDFRALDTLGEITVLAVAAIGIIALVSAGRLERNQARYGDPEEPTDHGAAQGVAEGDGR